MADARSQQKSRGQTRAFPELWNSASRNLAGCFRLQRRHPELEQRLESEGRDTRCPGGKRTLPSDGRSYQVRSQ
jgi:hypothetical protein